MENKEQNYKRKGDYHNRSHHGRDVFTPESVFTNLLNTVGYKIVGFFVRNKSRPNIRVPALDYLKNQDGDYGGLVDGN